MGMGVKLTDSQIEMIRSMSMKKLTQREIAEAVGCSVNTVGVYQKSFNIPASNRYKGGMISTSLRDDNDICRIPEKPAKIVNDCGVIVAEKVVTFIGAKTTFMYTSGTKQNSVKITTNNNVSDFVVELKDLVSFGNELLDIAEQIQKMKNEVTT